jgi:CspA family cold shock protein
MPVGAVKWFDCKKGFGFIVGTDNKDIFVHYSVIAGDGFRRLRDGEMVEYEVTTGKNGMLAASVVRRIEPAREGDQTATETLSVDPDPPQQ